MTMNSSADREWIQCWSNIWTILFTDRASLSTSQRCGARGHCQSLSNQLLFNDWNILKTHISAFCKLQNDTFTFSSQNDNIQICYVDPLMALLANDIQIQIALFINSLKSSVKAVLLHKHVSEQRSPTIHMKITFIMHLLVKHPIW